MLKNSCWRWIACGLIAAIFGTACNGQTDPRMVNDITQLNPIKVRDIVAPKTLTELVQAVKTHTGPISIGGGRFSMGGQTATENALQIDMSSYNQVLQFSKKDREITVQAGMTWRKLIQFIDQYDLSVKIMQTYANFTVGGSLSVNVHGRYIGQGPIILSVKTIKVVMANGEVCLASPTSNSDIFYAAIGGYGGIGVIAEVCLSLTENCKIERKTQLMAIGKYRQYFMDSIRNHEGLIFHNADIFPDDYQQVRAISYVKTSKPLTITDRLKPNDQSYFFDQQAAELIAAHPFGKSLRKAVDPFFYRNEVVEWRNYEATYDVAQLEPSSRKHITYVLQEYFVPIANFDSFYPKMAKILRQNKVNVMNVSIRHAKQDPGSMLAWAKTEVFAFVIYYRQGTSAAEREKVKHWTRQLIDAAIALKGSYYLPYQIHATPAQFRKAYPGVDRFFDVKRKYDPTYKFRNKLFDAYYPD
ncbi:MAG: FAD-binding oxidoreductase [Pedobacter sp.]|nr:FAD-binding oxidoreductase [Pedobacter sp.]MDQ8052769.1 FAD-binding oxidoreductase [Pedobacter sp.]